MGMDETVSALILSALFVGFAYNISKRPWSIPSNPVAINQYDVNRDGLEDMVFDDGTVQVKQENGAYISLAKMKQKEINSVKEKYELKPEQSRNAVDNLDYKVNTGRYFIGQ